MSREHRATAEEWWRSYAREMVSRAGTFFDQLELQCFFGASFMPPHEGLADTIRGSRLPR